MGAGFGMMLPGMIQQAMAAGSAASPPTPSGQTAGVADFADLAQAAIDPKQVVRSVAQAAGHGIDESGEPWQITIAVDSLRKQKVYVEFGPADAGGQAMITFWSICGPASQQNALALLRYNTQIAHGAFAVKTIHGVDMVVLQSNQAAATIDPLAVSRVLSAIAWQADKAEQKLTGGDAY